MPNAVIAHDPTARFDLDALKAEASAWPGLDGMDLAKGRRRRSATHWDETPWDWDEGYGRQPTRRSTMSSPSTTA